MQTGNIPVFTIGLFGSEVTDFWMGNLELLSKDFLEIQRPHQNNYYSILIVENAVGDVVIENEKIQMSNSQIIVINPNIINSIKIEESATGKIICFTDSFFSIRYNNNMLNDFSFLRKQHKSSITFLENQLPTNILASMESEFCSNKTDSKKALRSYLNILLIDIERLYCPSKISKIHGFSKEKAIQFQKLVEQHFKKHKLPSKYASMINVSTNYLNKISKQHFGVSSGEFIRNHILLESKKTLHYTNLSVSEVAFQLGFEYVSYFNSFFKKQTGETPKQFRLNSKNK